MIELVGPGECHACKASVDQRYELDEGCHLCNVCYLIAVPPERQRTAWRCAGCKTLMPWNAIEVMIKSEFDDEPKPYCDGQCSINKVDMLKGLMR